MYAYLSSLFSTILYMENITAMLAVTNATGNNNTKEKIQENIHIKSEHFPRLEFVCE